MDERADLADQIILGYAVRTHDPTGWTPARRARYLIDAEVPRVLSVDPAVSPAAARPWASQPINGLSLEVAPPRYRPPRQDDEDAGVGERDLVLAVAATRTDAGADGLLELAGAVRPADPSAEWRLLGHDVAETGLLSGLSNCGFETWERAAWRSCISPLHLLGRRDAHAYRRFLRDAVPEHGPWFIFGLWLLGELLTEPAGDDRR